MAEDTEIVALGDIKTIIGLSSEADDPALKLIIKQSLQACRVALGLDTSDKYPIELDYIPFEIAVKRYNRRRNEGMRSYNQEGQSFTFEDDEFAEFQHVIDEWRIKNGKPNAGTVVSFMNPYEWGH